MLAANATALVRQMMQDDSGATAIEYALLASGIGVAVAGTVFSLGGQIKTMLYDKIATIFE